MSTTPEPDDLEAVRTVVTALELFPDHDRERIIRWACEKLGISTPTAEARLADEAQARDPNRPDEEPDGDAHRRGVHLRTFVDEKQPGSDIQFAATVAYYYAFEAPGLGRKESITSDDLLEACRLAQRSRLQAPGKTLNNAVAAGYLDRADRGQFKVNAVGENLVAMALPGGTREANTARRRRSGGTKTTGTKKAAAKTSATKKAAAKTSATKKAAPKNRTPAAKRTGGK